LSSFDTILSHLETTSSALSTALARSRSRDDFPLAQAYLSFLVGPGIRTAKARVILGIDGLEKRVWGSRVDSCSPSRGTADDKTFHSKRDADLEEGDENEGIEGDAEEPDDSEEEEETDEESVHSDDSESDAESSRHHSVDPTPYMSRAEEQKILQNADRLLSRVLASALANGKETSFDMGEYCRPVHNKYTESDLLDKKPQHRHTF
jgi:hypothetical protein